MWKSDPTQYHHTPTIKGQDQDKKVDWDIAAVDIVKLESCLNGNLFYFYTFFSALFTEEIVSSW